jgi:hypothetical protein
VFGRCQEIILTLVDSDGYLIGLDVLIEDVFDSFFCKCIDVEWDVVIKAAPLLIKKGSRFLNNRVNNLYNHRASSSAHVRVPF